MGPLKLTTRIEHWPLTTPFRITGHTFTVLDVLWVGLEAEGHLGQGEAAGVYYRNDYPDLMIKQIESVRSQIESGLTSDRLQHVLPAGGARNALDCAWWDLQAKLAAQPVWKLVEINEPQSLLTSFGCGADTPENMARAARAHVNARAIKLKLTGEPIDADRVLAVREARSDVWLGIDANQGFTLAFLEELLPVLMQSRVLLIEQPLPAGQENLLDGFQSPISIAADESCQGLGDLPALIGRVDVVNIKLDKCGGLTEALAIARRAHEFGLETMVGNMIGTSLAMAPAFLVGQLCKVVDLDGPVFLEGDRPTRVQYIDGRLTCPPELWGGAL